MQKGLSLLRISLAILTLTAVSAGRTQTAKSEDYFPLTEGSTWKLAQKVNGDTTLITITITNSVSTGETTTARMELSRNDAVLTADTYRATATEVDRTATGMDGNDRITPPMPIIKYPLTAGAKWTWKGSRTLRGKDVKASSVSTVSGPISIRTEAGTFQAMKVHSDIKAGTGKNNQSSDDYYYAPGVGIVEFEEESGTFPIVEKLSSYNVK